MENVCPSISWQTILLGDKGDRHTQIKMEMPNFSTVKDKREVQQLLENKENYATQKLLNLISPQIIRNTLWSEAVKAAGRP